MAKSNTSTPIDVEVGRKSRKGRMFGFPWAEGRKKAFYILAEELKADNASSLARTILEQFMFSIFGPKKCRELGLLNEWEAKQIPPPTTLEYAIDKYKEHHGRLVDRGVSDADIKEESHREEGLGRNTNQLRSDLTKNKRRA
jgi:hypothetical protein